MKKVLVVDNSSRDAERLSSLFENVDDLKATVCADGATAQAIITDKRNDIAAIILLLEIPGPPFAFELLLQCRQFLPDCPLVVVSSALDASLATRAFALGARDFLEKPLDLGRAKRCFESLLSKSNAELPVVEKLSHTILGNSPDVRAMLKQVAKVIPHPETRVLLVGESGTGKELVAQGIHSLGPNSNAQCIAVNVGAIPRELIESQLFGHEKGAFTGATDAHQGYLEEAGSGTLFLDEIGDLDLSLQVKLLRVIQERKFRRLKGNKDLHFMARLVSATNRDLAQSVREHSFRRDLFHRIAEVTIHVPPLRERKGDVDLLLDHFLAKMRGTRKVRFARETLSILRSYPFLGNIRELENLVSAALIDCDGDWILPSHLPLQSMGVFLAAGNQTANSVDVESSDLQDRSIQTLFRELGRVLPRNWLDLPYKEIVSQYQHAFDRTYLPRLIARYRHNVTKATKAAGVDKKTFDKHWKEAGLPPLRSEEDTIDD